MISKKLLSLVLNKEITNYVIEGNELWYTIPGVFIQIINLDTLGRLFKEWCETQDYNAFSYPKIVKSNVGCRLYYKGNDANYTDEDLFFMGDTELKAIIKAAEFVANEKGLI